MEPVSERAIVLGWDAGLITSVSDPEGNGYLLSYTDDLLTELEMPDGCRIQLAYNGDQQVESRTDRVGFSTVYTYTDDRLTRVEGVFETEVLSEASWEYPEVEVVLPDFSRQNLTPQLQMAYDVWHRLVAVTSPNGNLEEVDNINLVGALNLLRNGSAELDIGGEQGEVVCGSSRNGENSAKDFRLGTGHPPQSSVKAARIGSM